MILSFKSKDLEGLWTKGRSPKIDARMHGRIIRRLDVLHASSAPQDANLPGFNFHPLQGKPQRYTIHVNGPWCLTFEWDHDRKGPINLDFEQYH